LQKTTILTDWRTKNTLHKIKNHLQTATNKRYTENEIVFKALVALAEKLNVQLPEEGSQENKQQEVCL